MADSTPASAAAPSLDRVALSATIHCLTGCAIGEVLGMLIGTVAGLPNAATVILSVALAFLFGYSLTSLPLLRAGMALAAVVPIAFAFAWPLNRWLIARGKGHAVVHETGIHGGPPTRIVGTVTAAAFVFGAAVLIAEAAG